MTKHVSARQVLAGVLVSALFLWLAVRDMHFDQLAQTFRQTRVESLLPALLLMPVSYLIRALRWCVPFHGRGIVPWPVAVSSAALGFAGNHYLPARLGEIVRIAAVNRAAAVPVGFAAGTILVERLVDVIVLVLFASLAMALPEGMPAWLTGPSILMAGACSLSAVLLMFAARVRLPAIFRTVQDGLQAYQHAPRLALVFAMTFAIWLLDALVAVIVASGFRMPITYLTALLLLACLGFSNAIPSAPGGIGVYQFIGVELLGPFGVPREQALAYVLGLQAVDYIAVTLFAVLAQGVYLDRFGSLAGKKRTADK